MIAGLACNNKEKVSFVDVIKQNNVGQVSSWMMHHCQNFAGKYRRIFRFFFQIDNYSQYNSMSHCFSAIRITKHIN